MSEEDSAARLEIEIKVRLTNPPALVRALPALSFRLVTPETMERNILLDTSDGQLRQRGQLLRIRQYGSQWVVTHKAPTEGQAKGAHKRRLETETAIDDGQALAAIFERLGYRPVFLYEKLRAEWTDGGGHAVVDRTPIGDFLELEGEPDWIDTIAAKLGILPAQYLTQSYGQLFLDWKRATKHVAANMTFAEVGEKDVEKP